MKIVNIVKMKDEVDYENLYEQLKDEVLSKQLEYQLDSLTSELESVRRKSYSN